MKNLAQLLLNMLHFLKKSSALEETPLPLLQNIGKFTRDDIMNYGKPV